MIICAMVLKDTASKTGIETDNHTSSCVWFSGADFHAASTAFGCFNYFFRGDSVLQDIKGKRRLK